MYLMKERYKQISHLTWNKKSAICDRSIYEDKIFAKQLYKSGIMNKFEYITYKDTFKTFSKTMKHPDFIVYLKVTPEIALKRIKERSRGCESAITIEFLQNLNKYYEKIIPKISKKIPILIIDYNDYKATEKDFDEIFKIIDIKLKEKKILYYNN